jgi:GNAT superfamily N-acetyltransferase
VDEAGEIARLWLRSRRASIPAIPPPVHSDQEVRAFFESVVVGEGGVWLLDRGDTIVGLLVVSQDGAWIDQLYVDPLHTGQGMGSRLIDWAKAGAPGPLNLWTFRTNLGARRFYERHGFRAIAATDGENEEGAPALHYRWDAPVRPAPDHPPPAAGSVERGVTPPSRSPPPLPG